MTSVSSLTATGTPAATTQAGNNAASSLGKDDFLKLFVAQLTHQDPMSPMDDTQMMGQMAQYSTLEQITNVAQTNQSISSSLSMSQSVGLLGKTVTYLDGQGASHTGVVQKIVTADGTPTLSIDGVDGIDPSSVSAVTTSSPTT